MMTPEEFAEKAEYEGVDYALNEYGLGTQDLEPGSPLYDAVKRFEAYKGQYQMALQSVEDEVAALL